MVAQKSKKKPSNSYRKKRRRVNVALPHTYFWNISKSPIMVYNGRVYHLSETKNERSSNRIKVDGTNYEFEESESLVDLEALYNTDFEKEIDESKSLFLNDKLKDSISTHVKWKIQSISKTKSMVMKNQALLIILEKIIPEIEGKNPIEHVEEYASRIPKEEIERFKEKLSEVERVVLDEKIRKSEIKGVLLKDSIGAVINNKDKSILGQYILHNFNMVIASPTEIYIFSNKKSNDSAAINGNNFYLRSSNEFKSIDNIESEYLEFLEHTFNYEALQGFDKTIEELEEVYKQEALLNSIIKGEQFEGQNGGFYRHSSGKYVFYVNVSQFVNKFPNGEYHLFPACKIAVGCTYDSLKKDFSIMRDHITVLSRYRHPFIKPFENGADESNFCTGLYTVPKGMAGYERIPQVLVELKTLLTSGYNSYHRNIDNVYGHYYSNGITRAEAIKKKIPITNEDVVVSEGIKKRYTTDDTD